MASDSLAIVHIPFELCRIRKGCPLEQQREALILVTLLSVSEKVIGSFVFLAMALTEVTEMYDSVNVTSLHHFFRPDYKENESIIDMTGSRRRKTKTGKGKRFPTNVY